MNQEEWFIQNKKKIKSISLVVIFENYYKRLEEMTVNKIYTQISEFIGRFFIKEKFAHSIVEHSKRTGNFLYLLKLK